MKLIINSLTKGLFASFCISLFLVSCKEDIKPSPSPTPITFNDSEISNRDSEEPDFIEKYYYDGIISTDSNLIKSAPFTVVDFSTEAADVETMHVRAFSTKQKYLDYGSQNNIPLGIANVFSSRMSFLADSAGLSENNPIPDWYTQYETQLLNQMYPNTGTSPQTPESFVFGLTFYDFKNLDYPLVFNPGPITAKPVMAYPFAFPYAWGNRVSRFKPVAFASAQVTLHDDVFYGGARITIVRNAPNAGKEVKLTSWSNRASSFFYALY
jgi:hypothetical protein